MVLRCHVQSHKQQTCLLARLMEFRACLNGFQNEHVHLTTSVEVAGSSRAILRYSFCRGRDILDIHASITLSILLVEHSCCTYMEAVTYVF